MNNGKSTYWCNVFSKIIILYLGSSDHLGANFTIGG